LNNHGHVWVSQHQQVTPEIPASSSRQSSTSEFPPYSKSDLRIVRQRDSNSPIEENEETAIASSDAKFHIEFPAPMGELGKGNDPFECLLCFRLVTFDGYNEWK